MSAVLHQVECFMVRHKWFCRITTTTISSIIASAFVAYALIKVLA